MTDYGKIAALATNNYGLIQIVRELLKIGANVPPGLFALIDKQLDEQQKLLDQK